MAQPVWISPPGDLGTVAEGLYFSTPVVAVDPDGGIVRYKLIAGSLPEGIQVKTNGVVEGVPQAFATVRGVPTEVSENVTSRFAVRAYVEVPGGIVRLSDRTFTLGAQMEAAGQSSKALFQVQRNLLSLGGLTISQMDNLNNQLIII